MRKLLLLLFLGSVLQAAAQDEVPSFKEDQIYFSIAYPYFSDAPSELIQNKLSYSFSLGFIRDMPINKKRTLAVGLGLGWESSTVFNNMQFEVLDDAVTATAIQGKYQKNVLNMQSFAVPFELRWRSATELKHAFWRIYSGMSFHLPIQLTAKNTSLEGVQKSTSLPQSSTLLRWNIHFGFNTWNISIAHDLRPWAKSNTTNNSFDIKFTKIGLIFYIL
ncbi:MAG: outer membrane beta-barrel protein [Flavobacteriaceae bacterium]